MLAGGLWWRAARRLRLRGYVVPRAQAVAWWSGIAVLVVALMGPVDTLDDQVLTAHMGQHLLIGDVAAPLVMLGLRSPIAQWYLPRLILVPLARNRPIRRFAGFVRRPVPALAIYVILLYGWHFAATFEGALRHPALHALQHECFFIGSALVWAAVIEPQRRRTPGHLWKIGYIGAQRLFSMFLGVGLVFSTTPWYIAFYGTRSEAHGLTPLNDQRFAGGMMMTVDIIVVFSALCWIFWKASQDADRAEAAERRLTGAPT